MSAGGDSILFIKQELDILHKQPIHANSVVFERGWERVRVDNAEISDEDKRMILCENAEWLFNL